jgi:hypothetical protein
MQEKNEMGICIVWLAWRCVLQVLRDVLWMEETERRQLDGKTEPNSPPLRPHTSKRVVTDQLEGTKLELVMSDNRICQL